MKNQDSEFTKLMSLPMKQWDKIAVLITQNTQEIDKKLDQNISPETRKLLLQEKQDNKAIKKEILGID